MSFSRSNIAFGWRYCDITSSSFGYNKYLWWPIYAGGVQSDVVNLHFVSELRPEVARLEIN